jgi:hypothetical protein
MHQGVVDLVPAALQHSTGFVRSGSAVRRWPTQDDGALQDGLRDYGISRRGLKIIRRTVAQRAQEDSKSQSYDAGAGHHRAQRLGDGPSSRRDFLERHENGKRRAR